MFLNDAFFILHCEFLCSFIIREVSFTLERLKIGMLSFPAGEQETGYMRAFLMAKSPHYTIWCQKMLLVHRWDHLIRTLPLTHTQLETLTRDVSPGESQLLPPLDQRS